MLVYWRDTQQTVYIRIFSVNDSCGMEVLSFQVESDDGVLEFCRALPKAAGRFERD